MQYEVIKDQDITRDQAVFLLDAQTEIRNTYGIGYFGFHRNYEYVFASDESGIVGCLLYYWQREHKRYWITTAYVRPDYRRRGILGEMLGKIDGTKQLDTAPTNEAMRAAMAKLGFKPWSITYEFKGPHE